MEDSRHLGKHLSKSASELAGHSLAHRTQSLFTSIKERWSRKKRRDEEGQSTDYAADNSSEQSTPKTQSPRHRQTSTVGAMAEEADCWYRVSPDQAKPDPAQLSAEEKKRRRESALRQHSFFQLRIHLRRGRDLVARDKSGTSDPYVKFKINGRLLYKSKIIYRDLNPLWDEIFTLPVEDPFIPVHIKVFDYDWGLQDDFMGSAYLDLTTFELGKSEDVILPLEDVNKSEAMGEIHLTATLLPKSQEDKEQVSPSPLFFHL